jgi:hypothetical protein
MRSASLGASRFIAERACTAAKAEPVADRVVSLAMREIKREKSQLVKRINV